MGYKTENNHIEVFCSDTLLNKQDKNIWSLWEIIINILYNNISINWDKADYQNSMHISNQSEWETTITINNITQLNCKESIIDIPFTGAYTDVMINTINIDNTLMKIGNLNKITTHR